MKMILVLAGCLLCANAPASNFDPCHPYRVDGVHGVWITTSAKQGLPWQFCVQKLRGAPVRSTAAEAVVISRSQSAGAMLLICQRQENGMATFYSARPLGLQTQG